MSVVPTPELLTAGGVVGRLVIMRHAIAGLGLVVHGGGRGEHSLLTLPPVLPIPARQRLGEAKHEEG